MIPTLGILSTLCSSFCFLSIYLRTQRSDEEYSEYYLMAASLVFLQPAIISSILVIGIVVSQKNDECRKDYTNIFIGIGRVVALLVACFEFLYISNKSVVGLFAIVGSVMGSFFMAEYLKVLQQFQLIYPDVEADFGFFKFIMTAAICAIQKLYGSLIYSAITVAACILLNIIHGSNWLIQLCPFGGSTSIEASQNQTKILPTNEEKVIINKDTLPQEPSHKGLDA